MSVPVIDVHTHMLSEAWVSALRDHGGPKYEVKPTKVFRAPTDIERTALQDLYDQLEGKDGLDAKELQDIVYAVGNAHPFNPLRDWFGAIYAVLLGSEQGPRFGSFIALYGVEETRKLIADALAGKLVKDAA